MSNILCPMCSKENPEDAQSCWYCGARLASVQEPGPTHDEAPEANTPDWLAEFRQDSAELPLNESDPVEQSERESEPVEDVPDWLAHIRSRTMEDAAAQPDPFGYSADAGSDEAPDWLKGFQESGMLPESGPQPEDRPQLEEEAQLPSAQNEKLSWLDQLNAGSDQSSDEPHEPVEAEQPEKDALSGFGLTGFLSSLESQEETPASPSPEAPDQEADEDQFDWSSLAGVASDDQSDLPGEPAWVEPFSTQAVTDWLVQPEGQAEAAEADIDQTEPPVQEDGAAETGGIPVWLSSVDEDSFAPQAGETGEVGLAFEGAALSDEDSNALPDWLAGFDQAAADTAPEPSMDEMPISWLEADQPAPIDQTGLLADTAAEEAVLGEEAVPGETAAADETMPDWLSEFSAGMPVGDTGETSLSAGNEAPPIQDGESVQPFIVELPGWLAEEPAAATAASGLQAAEPEEARLARADLPEWVKDMQPIESVLPGDPAPVEDDQRVEKAGPLAGLRGVLPVEESVARYSKLPVYSAKLRVTERQRSQAALLENILAQETQSMVLPPRDTRASSLALRVLTALVLITALLLPRILQLDPLVLPPTDLDAAPAELQDFYQVIDGAAVQDGAPVLLAVDYEPGLAGEMALTAGPVMDQLVSNQARIVILSTVPSGPALAQRLVNDAAARSSGYNLDEQVVNLGYLPGGTISLLEFARQPRLAAPVNLNGELAWTHPVLGNVTGLQSFEQIIVLTDSPETARAWVEQVQPSMGDVPLLMVSSAQAAPMIEPYIQSGQVQGMVSGVLGGLVYGRQAGQVNPAMRANFTSYQVGVLLAFGMVLIGGLVSGARAGFRRRQGRG